MTNDFSSVKTDTSGNTLLSILRTVKKTTSPLCEKGKGYIFTNIDCLFSVCVSLVTKGSYWQDGSHYVERNTLRSMRYFVERYLLCLVSVENKTSGFTS